MDPIQQRANKFHNLQLAMDNFEKAYAEMKLRWEQFNTPDEPDVIGGDVIRENRVIHIEKDANAIFVTSAPMGDDTQVSKRLVIFEDILGHEHPEFEKYHSDEVTSTAKELQEEVTFERYFAGATLSGDIVSGEVVIVGQPLRLEERLQLGTHLGLVNMVDIRHMSDDEIAAKLDELNVAKYHVENK